VKKKENDYGNVLPERPIIHILNAFVSLARIANVRVLLKTATD
jgi:hypothetical protein